MRGRRRPAAAALFALAAAPLAVSAPGTYAEGALAEQVYDYLAGLPGWRWRWTPDPEAAAVRIGPVAPGAPWLAGYRPLALATRRDGTPVAWMDVARPGAGPEGVLVRSLATVPEGARALPDAPAAVLGVYYRRVTRARVPAEAVNHACRVDPRVCPQLELTPLEGVRWGVWARRDLPPGELAAAAEHLHRLGHSPRGDALLAPLGADNLGPPPEGSP